MTGWISALLLASLLVGAGCDSSGTISSCPGGETLPVLGCATPAAVSCTRRVPSVPTGVYGCITASDDVGPIIEPVAAFPMFPVEIFRNPPPPTPGDGLMPEVSTRSDTVGFYELRLAPGRYWICTSFRRCGQIDVPASAPLRLNYDFGQGPGW
jgi:hypothetical protein